MHKAKTYEPLKPGTSQANFPFRSRDRGYGTSSYTYEHPAAAADSRCRTSSSSAEQQKCCMSTCTFCSAKGVENIMGRCYREKNRTRHFDRDKHLCVVKSSCVVMSFLGGTNKTKTCHVFLHLDVFALWVVGLFLLFVTKGGGLLGGFGGGSARRAK